MPTNVYQSRLALAQAKFRPLARVLDRLSEDIEKEHGRPAALKPRGAMEQTAENAFAVRYALRQPDEARLSLTFRIVGEDADLLLLEGHERSGSPDFRADPGQVDQCVYRLAEVEEIKAAVKAKIVDHLRARGMLQERSSPRPRKSPVRSGLNGATGYGGRDGGNDGLRIKKNPRRAKGSGAVQLRSMLRIAR
jgi:hypothetical protein